MHRRFLVDQLASSIFPPPSLIYDVMMSDPLIFGSLQHHFIL